MPVRPIKALEGLTGPLRWLLVASVVVTAAAVASDVYSYVQYSALPESSVFSETYLSSDAVMFVVTALQILLTVATAIVFLMWVHRANANLRALSGVPMRFTPGWSVGWFFVPIMSLFRPYQVVRELWHVSHGTTESGHGVVGLWWALFILSGVASRGLSQIAPAPKDTADFLVSTAMYIVIDTIDSLGLAVTLVMVMRVARAYAVRIDESAAPLMGAMQGMPGVPVTTVAATQTLALGPASATPAGPAPVAPAAVSAPDAAAAASTRAVLPPAAWHPDPVGRHQLRWWDGAEWTEWVGDAGEMTEDPV